MGKLDGKVAIVTGGSKGIGKGIAKAALAEGAHVVIAARDAEALGAAATELGADDKVAAAPTDVTDEIEVASLFDLAVKRFGRVDILVNNAGAFNGGPLDELDVADWDHVVAVNLRGPFLCTREAIRWMKKQGDGGRILNIGSISAQRVRPNSGPYSTTKHGLWGLTQVTALEGRDHGISCGCLHPGNTYVERRQESGKGTDDEPMMSVDELAEVALTMLTAPKHMSVLEAIAIPIEQKYVGRG
jgi:NAD(P)-dependent dehydrogenase (short-subunit alcohol dehydrogenase family)